MGEERIPAGSYIIRFNTEWTGLNTEEGDELVNGPFYTVWRTKGDAHTAIDEFIMARSTTTWVTGIATVTESETVGSMMRTVAPPVRPEHVIGAIERGRPHEVLDVQRRRHPPGHLLDPSKDR